MKKKIPVVLKWKHKFFISNWNEEINGVYGDWNGTFWYANIFIYALHIYISHTNGFISVYHPNWIYSIMTE